MLWHSSTEDTMINENLMFVAVDSRRSVRILAIRLLGLLGVTA